MKRFTAILLASFMLLAPAGKIWLLVSFQINQQYIIANLCEQRAIMGNACQGSCYVQKELEKAREDAKHVPSSLKFQAEVLFFESPRLVMPVLPAYFAERLTHQSRYLAPSARYSPQEIQHPPNVL